MIRVTCTTNTAAEHQQRVTSRNFPRSETPRARLGPIPNHGKILYSTHSRRKRYRWTSDPDLGVRDVTSGVVRMEEEVLGVSMCYVDPHRKERRDMDSVMYLVAANSCYCDSI